jgi:hypothetical protein
MFNYEKSTSQTTVSMPSGMMASRNQKKEQSSTLSILKDKLPVYNERKNSTEVYLSSDLIKNNEMALKTASATAMAAMSFHSLR